MPLLLILLAFLLIAARYASAIELWGDEAFSLLCAGRDWHQMFQSCDAHFPTYYDLQLRPMLWALSSPLSAAKSDLALRMLHVPVFAIGLGFCWLIGREQLRNRGLLIGLMVSIILLPNYIFYAVNIRMYALLFSCSMAFAWACFRVLVPGRVPLKSKVLYALTGLSVSLVDYPGLFLFVITTLFLLVIHVLAGFSRRGRLALSCFAVSLLVASGVFLRDQLQGVMQWPGFASMALVDGDLKSLLKFVFFAIRPFLDLIYPPASPLFLNVLLWLLIGLALVWSLTSLIRQGGKTNYLIVFFSTYWLILSPVGLAFTRVALPAQFFAMLSIVLAVEKSLSLRRSWIAFGLTLGLLSIGAFNLWEAVFPTLRLYSRIPYQQIAHDALASARQGKIDLIVISRHTLNALSVDRYLRPAADSEIEVMLADPRPTCGSFPGKRFVYVQLMPEDGEASDPVEACKDIRKVEIQNIKNYVAFESLGYNRLWIGSLADKAGSSSFAARLLNVDIQ